MADYRVFETRSFSADIEELDPPPKAKLKAWLKERIYPELRREPRRGGAIKRLRDWTPDTWRYRIGDWRFFYEIDEKERLVFMTALDRRSEGTYRR